MAERIRIKEWAVTQPQMIALDYSAATHIGGRRSNEDAVRANPADGRHSARGHLFAVADGMGGHNGGGVASRLACEGLNDYYRRSISGKPPWGAHFLRRHLADTVMRIDRRIRSHGHGDAALADMGTTLSCLVVTAGQTIIAHVGDSRVYRMRRGHLSCLTCDHTFVQDMIFEGAVDPAHAVDHPLRHVLTRVVGTAEPLEWVDTRVDPLKGGDRFLLCSDGLHNSLAPEQLARVLDNLWPARQIAAALINAALQAGATDNITAIVIKA